MNIQGWICAFLWLLGMGFALLFRGTRHESLFLGIAIGVQVGNIVWLLT